MVGLALGCGQTHIGPDAAEPLDAHIDAGPPDAGPPDAEASDAGFDAGPPDAGPPIHARAYAFCVEMRELRCRGTEVCCGLPDRVGFLEWDTQCGVHVEGQCEAWAGDTALHDGTLRWNEAEAATLLITLRAALETCGVITRPFDVSAVFEGTLAEGEECTPERPYAGAVGRFRCQEGLRCALTGDSRPGRFSGICAPKGDLGDSCNYDCRPGLWCDSSLREGGNPFLGRCALDQDPDFDCGRDSWCRTRYCDHITTVRCIEPEPAQTWCGFIGLGGG